MTDFGYREVDAAEKTRLVGRVFDSVATRYDLMNDLMSLGVHRLWKRHFVETCGIRPGQRVLDLAGGTGDIAQLVHARLRGDGLVVIADINRAMLETGRSRLDDAGCVDGIAWLQADAETLPLVADCFDHVTIAFGLRNVTDRARALLDLRRVLKHGGQLHVLEFSRVKLPALARLYDTWSFRVLPGLGRVVAGDADSYRYLAESIRRFPDQPTLAGNLREAGFERVGWSNLSGGICAIHRGVKL